MRRFVGFVLAVIVLTCAHANESANPAEPLDMRVQGPFWWSGTPASNESATTIQEAIDRKNPYQVFHRLYRTLLQHRADPAELGAVVEQLDYMLEQYEPAIRKDGGVIWQYGHPHGKIPSGWWSGMEGFQGSLALYSAGEILSSERYTAAGIASARLYLKPPSEGGVLWKKDGKCWISEYAWKGMSEGDEFHVLNGHLLGLLALYLLSDKTGLPDLEEAYQCARAGTEALAETFYFKSDVWTNYQTTPTVLNQTHYLLFETVLFEALFTLTNDPFYDAEAARRKAIFAKQYPVVVTYERGRYRALVSAIGAPHPYNPDNYGFELTCKTADGAITKGTHFAQFDTGQPRAARLVFALDLTTPPMECRYEMRRAEFGFELYTQREFQIVSKEIEDLPVKLTASLDAVSLQGEEVTIEPSFKADVAKDTYLNNEGRITFRLGREIENRDMIALVLHSTKDFNLATLLTDSAGKTVGRYQMPISKDCDNLILVNRLGFEGGADLSKLLQSLTLRIFTDAADQQFRVKVKRASMITNPAQLRSLLENESDVCFPA